MGKALHKARNLGPTSEAELNSIGFHSLEDLLEAGWEDAFIKLVEHYPHRLNLNMAAALIGAVEDCDWREIPISLKSHAKKLILEMKSSNSCRREK